MSEIKEARADLVVDMAEKFIAIMDQEPMTLREKLVVVSTMAGGLAYVVRKEDIHVFVTMIMKSIASGAGGTVEVVTSDKQEMVKH